MICIMSHVPTKKSFYLSKKNIDGSLGAPDSSLIYTFSLANMATRIKRKRRCVGTVNDFCNLLHEGELDAKLRKKLALNSVCSIV
jgi:hypothetical protein